LSYLKQLSRVNIIERRRACDLGSDAMREMKSDHEGEEKVEKEAETTSEKNSDGVSKEYIPKDGAVGSTESAVRDSLESSEPNSTGYESQCEK
jgi:hypothetical protein